MSSEALPAISVDGLSKNYTLRAGAAAWWKRRQRNTFHALTDVSFSVCPGEVVGIVGRNGAGKSTLLKILTRITAPSAGQIDLYGRVGSLLEVGTGFHPELTGRENVYLNGAILGMRRSEIRSEFDAIVAFAGVERFLDTPVKRYSSGMYVRLAFAVAAHLRSEILLIDEVLAVGDIEFQKRCLGKMRDVARSGRTILFVSHHLPSVSALCQRLLVLENGRLVHDGPVQSGVERYMAAISAPNIARLSDQRRPGSGELRVKAAFCTRGFQECSGLKSIQFSIVQCSPFDGRFFISIHLVDSLGTVIAQCDSRLSGQWFEAEEELGFEFRMRTPWLKPGAYRIDIFLCSSGFIDQCEHACAFDVLPLLPYPGAGGSEATAHGLVLADFEFARMAQGVAENTDQESVLANAPRAASEMEALCQNL